MGSIRSRVVLRSLVLGLGLLLGALLGAASLAAAAPGPRTFGPGASDTVTSVTSDVNPANVGQVITFTVTVTTTGAPGTPGGTINLYDGNSPIEMGIALTNGQAQYQLSTLSVGSHDITADYVGQPEYNPSTSDAYTQEVLGVPTTTTMTSSTNPATYGRSITLAATITPDSGTDLPTAQWTSTRVPTCWAPGSSTPPAKRACRSQPW